MVVMPLMPRLAQLDEQSSLSTADRHSMPLASSDLSSLDVSMSASPPPRPRPLAPLEEELVVPPTWLLLLMVGLCESSSEWAPSAGVDVSACISHICSWRMSSW